ncbi:hypothetical protein HAX54_009526 [Datura stramonium]|uniref:malate synthase n=1 Tax=Datura stramonium TaxID=4076 RepID=A0ABS8RWY2_DATST|nr:hypothetical protein [Datura stramonium]
MRGHVNLRDAVNGTISFHDQARNRVYRLNDQTAKLFVRPRGWHLPEAHIFIDGEPATGCLVDFGLYFFHNYANFRRTQGQGYGPFYYLPKMEHSREARIWNNVFERAEKWAGIEKGSIRATVLIETLPAAHPDRLLPDRVQVGMAQHFMRSYSDLLIHTCHKRGVHAMGGMAAQIPIRDDPAANEAALELVRKDKLREVKAGHDGTWAAHPGLIPACMEGAGSVPFVLEDAATAEISRVQNWQWLKYGVELDGDGLGVKVNSDLFGRVVEEEMARIEREVGKEKFKEGMYKEACKLFTRQCTAPVLDDFLTLDAYNNIVMHHPIGSSRL